MKIINFVQELTVYYDDRKDVELVFKVSESFWEQLSSSGIQYRSGDLKKDMAFTEVLILKLTDPGFSKIFPRIANSGIGRQVLIGALPPETVL